MLLQFPPPPQILTFRLLLYTYLHMRSTPSQHPSFFRQIVKFFHFSSIFLFLVPRSSPLPPHPNILLPYHKIFSLPTFSLFTTLPDLPPIFLPSGPSPPPPKIACTRTHTYTSEVKYIRFFVRAPCWAIFPKSHVFHTPQPATPKIRSFWGLLRRGGANSLSPSDTWNWKIFIIFSQSLHIFHRGCRTATGGGWGWGWLIERETSELLRRRQSTCVKRVSRYQFVGRERQKI